MKTNTKALLLSLLLLVILGHTGCSLDSINRPNAFSSSALVGYWARTYTSNGESFSEMWKFNADKTGVYANSDESDPASLFSFNWSLGGDELVISNTGGTVRMQITNLTSDALTLVLNNQRYNYTRYVPDDSGSGGGDSGGGSGSGDNTSTNYAPSSMTNYKFYCSTYATSYTLYFTSNYGVNSSTSYISGLSGQYKVSSVSYSKTSNNKATITVSYSTGSTTKTDKLYLTFTSYGGGTMQYENDVMTYNFTCEYIDVSSVEAPSSLAYKKFVVGRWTWYQFGAANGSSLTVTSSSESSDTKVTASYNKTGSTTGTLVIRHVRTYGSTTYTYKLTFTSSSSEGNYALTSTNSYMPSASGTFTLE